MKDLLKKALLKLNCRYFRKSIREILFFNIPHDGFANGIPVSIFIEKENKEEKFIEKIKLEKLIDKKYRKLLAIQNFFRITTVIPKEKDYIVKVINYTTELGMLTKLKNNNLISDADYEKIKTKIMIQYGVTSELMI